MPNLKQSNWEERWEKFVIEVLCPNKCGFLRFKIKDLLKAEYQKGFIDGADITGKIAEETNALELKQREHDHEILINTLLETKNNEIIELKDGIATFVENKLAERDKQWLSCRPTSEPLTEKDVFFQNWNNEFISNAKKLNLIK